ncbi:hypothetical protein ACFYO2_39385 [Streptomyces sp. NPDC006602]|uniref:hypothetical protein n=1 Tax=Streptomyces sp. NPDC006602 TaxID=3364751 RepID=UPI0036932B96
MNPTEASGAQSRSTNTPKFSIPVTTPVTTLPGRSDSRKSLRAFEGSGYVTAQTLFRTSEYPNLPTVADATGKGNFYTLGGPLGGNYALDQAFHHAMETAAALITASK